MVNLTINGRAGENTPKGGGAAHATAHEASAFPVFRRFPVLPCSEFLCRIPLHSVAEVPGGAFRTVFPGITPDSVSNVHTVFRPVPSFLYFIHLCRDLEYFSAFHIPIGK
jgi:hypothetical protein